MCGWVRDRVSWTFVKFSAHQDHPPPDLVITPKVRDQCRVSAHVCTAMEWGCCVLGRQHAGAAWDGQQCDTRSERVDPTSRNASRCFLSLCWGRWWQCGWIHVCTACEWVDDMLGREFLGESWTRRHSGSRTECDIHSDTDPRDPSWE